jgi:hypothetical protein
MQGHDVHHVAMIGGYLVREPCRCSDVPSTGVEDVSFDEDREPPPRSSNEDDEEEEVAMAVVC